MSEKQFSKDSGWEISEFKDAHGSSDKDMIWQNISENSEIISSTCWLKNPS